MTIEIEASCLFVVSRIHPICLWFQQFLFVFAEMAAAVFRVVRRRRTDVLRGRKREYSPL